MNNTTNSSKDNKARNERIANLLTIGISEDEAIRIVDSEKHSIWEMASQTIPVPSLIIAISTFVIALYSLLRSNQYVSSVEPLTTKVSKLETFANSPLFLEHTPNSFTLTVAPTIAESTLTYTPASESIVLMGKITAPDGVVLRSGPGTSEKNLGFLIFEEVVQIIAKSKDSLWLQVWYPEDSKLGWVASQFIVPMDSQWEINDIPLTPLPTITPAVITPTIQE